MKPSFSIPFGFLFRNEEEELECSLVFDAGMTGYLAKPVDISLLLKELSGILPRS